MKLLFKREQTYSPFGRARFKLWSKIELEDDEKAVIKHYALDAAILIHSVVPDLMRKTGLVAFGAFILSMGLFMQYSSFSGAFFLATLAGAGVGYLYYDRKRETIFVRDLLHGRNFTCPSVIELARKEAWLHTITGFLRQVMESARHWDGTQSVPVPAMSPEEAKQLIITGL